MFKVLASRLSQGHRTSTFPRVEPTMPDRFRGLPRIDASRCEDGCRACADVCPTDAVLTDGSTRIDLGRCLFCNACVEACPQGAIELTTDYRLATSTREALVTDGRALELAHAAEARILRMYGRALRLREVSAAGCNGCEADVNVLSTIAFDLSRFGIQIVASPRHADGLVITGPVSRNMLEALRICYEAVPPPRIVIAVGACAISGGPFIDLPEQCNGAQDIVPVDLFIPGCPPHPLTILDGILRFLAQREARGAR